MNYFPKTLKHSSGRRLILQTDFVGLRLNPKYNRKDKNTFIDKLDLKPEEFYAKTPVIDRSGFDWVRPKPEKEIIFSEEYLDNLERQNPEDIYNISPVYKLTDVSGTEAFTTIISDVLLVRFSNHLNRKEEDEVFSRISKYGFEFDKAYSQWQGRYKYFRARSREINIFKAKSNIERYVVGVRDVDFDYQPVYLPHHFEPSDEFYPDQWNMEQVGAGGPGTTAWDFSLGDPSVVVAVIDSGVHLDHIDLRNNLQSTGFLVKNDGGIFSDTDPDPNPDPLLSLFFVLPSNGSPVRNSSFVLNTHGTKVAGVIAAEINNAKTSIPEDEDAPTHEGIAGLAGGCKILPFAIEDYSSSSINAAINRAASEGVKVINISMGNLSWQTDYLDLSIDDVVNVHDVVICASTGNVPKSDDDYDTIVQTISYPALHPNVIACGSTTRPTLAIPNESKREDARYLAAGNPSNGVTVVAPGTEIPTTSFRVVDGVIEDIYDRNFRQTSAAAPQVSALAALIRSVNDSLTAAEVRTIIEETAEKINTATYSYSIISGFSTTNAWNQQLGYGRINILLALEDERVGGTTETERLKAAEKEIETLEQKNPKETTKESLENSHIEEVILPLQKSITFLQNRLKRLEDLDTKGSSFISKDHRPNQNPSER